MFPIGTYERLISKIKGREMTRKADLIGILFADIRQSETKEYILNYLDTFNSTSGKFIDFYIPGYYIKEEITKGHETYYGFEKIEVDSKTYIFSVKEYEKAIQTFAKDFGVKRRYVPALYLIEWSNGNFSNAEIIEIELNKSPDSVKNTGELFDVIFELSKKGTNILSNSKSRSINNTLTVSDLRDYLLGDFASDTGIPVVASVFNIGKRLLSIKL